jgi:RNA polymerase sigma factor (sigma-70 family)
VRAGDDAAFEAIYDRYARGLLAFCGHMLGSREEAEDVLQHSFVSAYRALRDSESEIVLRPWLYTIARNRCLSELRSRRETVEAAADDDCAHALDGLPAEVQRRAELRDLVEDMQRLPADQRAALVLFELGDQSHRDIAVVLGVRKEKVKALVFQAREALLRTRRARDTPCAEVREEIATRVGRLPRRSTLRAHVDHCAACAAFELDVRRQRRALAAILPIVPSAGLKAAVLGSVIRGGGAIAAAGGAAAGGGSAAIGGAATTAGGAGAGGAAGVATAGAGTIGMTTGAGAAGAGTIAGGGAAAATGATTVATAGLAGAGTVAAGGVAGLGAKAFVAKILTVVAVTTGGVVAPDRDTGKPDLSRSAAQAPVVKATAPQPASAPTSPASEAPKAPAASTAAPATAAPVEAHAASDGAPASPQPTAADATSTAGRPAPAATTTSTPAPSGGAPSPGATTAPSAPAPAPAPPTPQPSQSQAPAPSPAPDPAPASGNSAAPASAPTADAAATSTTATAAPATASPDPAPSGNGAVATPSGP